MKLATYNINNVNKRLAVLLAWLDDADQLRRQFGGVELAAPERTAARSVNPL